MKQRLAAILFAAAVVTVGVFKFVANRNPATAQSPVVDESDLSVRASERSNKARAGQGASTEAFADTPPPSEPATAVLPQPKPVHLTAVEQAPSGPEAGDSGSGLTPVTVLENMRSAFRQYQSRFRENPVGDNAEITRALNGANPARATFVQAEDGLRINARGELIDNWGTPFFFHQLSRTQMEIRSAGPDRRMWSADDLVMK